MQFTFNFSFSVISGTLVGIRVVFRFLISSAVSQEKVSLSVLKDAQANSRRGSDDGNTLPKTLSHFASAINHELIYIYIYIILQFPILNRIKILLAIL